MNSLLDAELPPEDYFAHCKKCGTSMNVAGSQAQAHTILMEFRTKHAKCLRKVR